MSEPGLLACGCDDGSVSVANVSTRNVRDFFFLSSLYVLLSLQHDDDVSIPCAACHDERP